MAKEESKVYGLHSSIVFATATGMAQWLEYLLHVPCWEEETSAVERIEKVGGMTTYA